MRRFLPFVALLALIPTAPHADGSITATAEAIKLYRGSTIIAASDPLHATYRANFTADACRALLTERWQAEAATKTTGTIQYKCQIEERATVTFKKAAACPTAPPDQTRPGACPAGTQGSWTQTGTTTYGAAPACAPTVTWRPVASPEGICRPVALPPLPMPTGVVTKAESTSTIKISWNPVADAVAYSIQRCIGDGCINFTQLSCLQALQRVHGALSPGTTVRYKVAGARDASCSDLGTFSGIEIATTLTGTAPPPDPEPEPEPEPEQPPTACTGRECELKWDFIPEPPAEGFRIVYGRTADALTNTVQVASGTARSYRLTLASGGTWYFGVMAYTGGNASPVSNVVARTVQ